MQVSNLFYSKIFSLYLHLRQCDQTKQGIVNNLAKMDEYVKEHGFAGWFETSAKENINIEEAARALVNKVSAFYIQALDKQYLNINAKN